MQGLEHFWRSRTLTALSCSHKQRSAVSLSPAAVPGVHSQLATCNTCYNRINLFFCGGSFRPNHAPYNHIIIRIRSCQLFLAFSPVRSIVTVSRELFLHFPGSPRSAAHLLSANPRLCRSQCRLSSRRCSKWKTFPVLSTDPTLSCSQGTISCHPRPES